MKIRNMLPKEEQPIIIAMTASAMKEDRENYLKVMDDFLAKVPFALRPTHGSFMMIPQELVLIIIFFVIFLIPLAARPSASAKLALEVGAQTRLTASQQSWRAGGADKTTFL